MNYFKSLILIHLFISILGNVVKADYLGIEIIHYTRHFSNKSIELGEKYPRKLDAKGVHIITPGIEVYFDNEINYEDIPIPYQRWTFASYLDSMNLKAGYIHYGPRFSYNIKDNLNLFFGLGPAFYFRESWNRFDEYRDDGFFQESKNYFRGYQFKLLPAGDIDFQYYFSDEIQFVWSIIPGLPDVITNATGLRIKW